MGAKERIIETAIRLFNEQGTGKVSTNHIAAAAGISPGNLYYHFHNKEEIVEAILDQMYAKWSPVWSIDHDVRLTQEHLRGRLMANFEILWDFRFFYREAIVLLLSDEALKQKHLQMMNSRLADQEAFVGRFVQDGVLHFPHGSEQLRKLLTSCWIVAGNWLAFLEMNGETVTPAKFSEGVELIWAILLPYLANHPEGAE